MNQIITIHSFRRGAGKSNLVANLAVLLAQAGRRVAVLDADFQAPSLHIFFGLSEKEFSLSLNDYLWGKGELAQAVHDVGAHLGRALAGQILLLPASPKTGDIMRMLRQAYDFDRLQAGLTALFDQYQVDTILLDTSAGLNEETLMALAACNLLLLVLRPDPQEYQGAAVTLEVARNLKILQSLLVLNDAPVTLDFAQAKTELESAYNCEIAAILPHNADLMALSSAKLYALQYPTDAYSALLRQLAARL
jgi:MinD-like ATPase involved in chromosome partitioning or flagellar assembly